MAKKLDHEAIMFFLLDLKKALNNGTDCLSKVIRRNGLGYAITQPLIDERIVDLGCKEWIAMDSVNESMADDLITAYQRHNTERYKQYKESKARRAAEECSELPDNFQQSLYAETPPPKLVPERDYRQKVNEMSRLLDSLRETLAVNQQWNEALDKRIQHLTMNLNHMIFEGSL